VDEIRAFLGTETSMQRRRFAHARGSEDDPEIVVWLKPVSACDLDALENVIRERVMVPAYDSTTTSICPINERKLVYLTRI